ncbi:hypothetical protein SAICODRAFT_17557 [Saitoella complicata NRRL Y-17804]|nr:uncharacterized protein SAICODRAFT_17557 [Saitoella complicata NRRL Y-17804]ODQ55158.1 hypothetical protein SAICODRAFT_17557 [Saitoella complicata NRRL Y-17804]
MTDSTIPLTTEEPPKPVRKRGRPRKSKDGPEDEQESSTDREVAGKTGSKRGKKDKDKTAGMKDLSTWFGKPSTEAGTGMTWHDGEGDAVMNDDDVQVNEPLTWPQPRPVQEGMMDEDVVVLMEDVVVPSTSQQSLGTSAPPPTSTAPGIESSLPTALDAVEIVESESESESDVESRGRTMSQIVKLKIGPELLRSLSSRSQMEEGESVVQVPATSSPERGPVPESSQGSLMVKLRISTPAFQSKRKEPEHDEPLPAVKDEKAVPKTVHPFFGGAKARKALTVRAKPVKGEDEDDESSKKRRRKSSEGSVGEPMASVAATIEVVQPAPRVEAGPQKATHPFFKAKPSSTSTSAPGSFSWGGGARDPFRGMMGNPKINYGIPTPWPSADNMHVRDLPPTTLFEHVEQGGWGMGGVRKGKAVAVEVSEREDVLKLYEEKLSAGMGSGTRCLFPEKVLTTGAELQKFAELQYYGKPALQRMFRRIKEKTAFDCGKVENQMLVTKYAPTKAEEVLTDGKAAKELKEWLGEMKVALKRARAAPPPKKKGLFGFGKKRDEDMDDFIVDDDEVMEEMPVYEEIEDSDDKDFNAPGLRKKMKREKKAVLEVPSNVIILEGPHGCGKTAAVYAVAQELGFEVFEINAGGKRSGKDILDQVGEMSQSHLVHQHKKGEKESEKKDSLILIEEVDVLFEEDKGFWQTVLSLSQRTKRAMVLTCNDPVLLPAMSLESAVRLKFEPVSVKTVAEYLHLMTLAEGHLVDKADLEALYETKGNDLRAAIMELDFYLQMGIGDRKAGLDWLHLPKRGVVDDVRIASKGTYRRGLDLGEVETDEDIVSGMQTVFASERFSELLSRMVDVREKETDVMSLDAVIEKPPLKDLGALDAFMRYADDMSFMDTYVDQQHTTFEVPQPKVADDELVHGRAPHLDDVIGYPILAPTSARYTMAGLDELRYSPATQVLIRECFQQRCANLKDIRIMAFAEVDRSTLLSCSAMSVESDRSVKHLIKDEAFADLALLPGWSHNLYPHTVAHRPLAILTTDLGPHVRDIVRHDQQAAKIRTEQSSLLCMGGGQGRGRNTRAAAAASGWGGRREKYLEYIDADVVLRTAGSNWIPDA